MADRAPSEPGATGREPARVVLNGRYELHSRIARGGMAEVYLARDQLLDRPVAIKVLFPEFAVDPSFVERFRREAQSAANLNHPAIVGVYDWGSHEGTYFIVMEYVRGRSLADVLRAEGTLHPDRAADIATDIAGALSFAHRNGVVHRDVKPGNVLISPQGQVKVTDFGIARAVGGNTDNLTQTGSVMGTATYFSPEQAQGFAVDPRSDLYSLGVVLYEMLVGRPPFAGESPVTIAYKHVQEAPVPPRRVNAAVPAELEAVCLKLLAKNPVNRYASAEELRADLRRYREGQPVRAERVLDPGAVAPTSAIPGLAGAVAAGPAAAGATMSTAPTRAMPSPQRVSPYGNLRTPDGGTEVLYADGPPATYQPPRRNGVFIAVLVVLLAVLGGLLFALARVLSAGGDDTPAATLVDVPEVTGKTFEEADALLRAAGFRVQREDQRNDVVPIGSVVSQDPRGGTKRDADSVVKVVVSAAEAQISVPDVLGEPLANAQRLLQAAGFDPTKITVTQKDDDKAAKDVVLEQNPLAGVLAKKDQAINLVIAKGSTSIAAPAVAGKTCEEAIAELVKAGLRENRLTCVQTPNDKVEAGKVIGTEPANNIPTNVDVKVLVSSGPAKVQVPSVVNLTQGSAETAVLGAGLQVKVEFEPRADRVDRVIRQSPSAGETVAAGSAVTIVVGQEPPAPPTTEATTTTSTTRPTTTSTTAKP